MIKNKVTVYCDAEGCKVNQTLVGSSLKTGDFSELGWAMAMVSDFCPRHGPLATGKMPLSELKSTKEQG